ncbi:MAG: CopG family transcriptional regulator, partial [Candidatus Electrothrix sp. ATG2]|nr:CopG family transcriptional regulator [Candidatus Electrothrix sp. ATG2]
MITLRLDPQLEQLLKNTAENLGLLKSELIRRSIFDYIGRLKNQNAWDAGQ